MRSSEVRVSSYVRFFCGPSQYTGWPASTESSRSRSGVAATGVIAGTTVVWAPSPEESPCLTTSQTRNAAAIAIATTAPIRTSGRRAQGATVGSFTATKDRFRAGGHRPARLQSLAPGRLAQLGEHQLDKLGVTGSSPVPPTPKSPLKRAFSLAFA